ncbi:MAG: sigma-70 family RNA polymerase sigma factor [Armatimonadota bacterium]|nr:sigma-70 family RNA polymerase sigma factor [Armatimonadota bacterium]
MSEQTDHNESLLESADSLDEQDTALTTAESVADDGGQGAVATRRAGAPTAAGVRSPFLARDMDDIDQEVLMRLGDEEAVLELFRRLRGPLTGIRNHDRTALRDHLVMMHAPLVEHCARNFSGSSEPLEDLAQEGYVGLIKAVDRFDPDKGVRFSTYACHLITGEIRHYLRDLGKLIHEPGWHSELRQRITRTAEQLMHRLNRPPEPEEIAETLNISTEQVLSVMQNQQVLAVDSLEAKSGGDDDESSGVHWSEEIAAEGPSAENRVDDQLMLKAALPQLKDLEKRAVTLFFFEERSKTEIARTLGISINYAAYLINRGVEHLRQIIETSEGIPAATWAQKRARGAYLLALAQNEEGAAAPRGAGKERRTSRKPPSVPAVSRSRVGSLPEFAGWLDEEVQRAQRYDQEFGVLWLRIRNWKDLAEHVGDVEAERAATTVQNLARKSCRTVDKVAVLSPGALSGLNILVLMPQSGASGQRAGERWLAACRPEAIYPGDPAAAEDLHADAVFAVYPRDGKNSDDLFRFLGSKIRALGDD